MKLRDILLKENNKSCPAATQDLMLNTKNRDASIKSSTYTVWTAKRK